MFRQTVGRSRQACYGSFLLFYCEAPRPNLADKFDCQSITVIMTRYGHRYIALLGGCTALLIWGIRVLDGAKNLKAGWEIGLGNPDSRTLIAGLPVQRQLDGSIPPLTAIFIANAVQPILSGAYFLYNSLFTSMAMAGEWDRYALQHKGLRVSTLRSGEQRSSHLLQLPYRLVIPIMTLSGVMHWAASQSIFLVDVVYQPAQGFDSPRYRLIAGDGRTSTTCGYSPQGILVFICLGLVMVLLLIFT